MLDWLRIISLVNTGENLGACAAALESQGLITIELVHNIKIYKLKQKGADVALGYVVVEGVARPGPDCLY